MPAMQPNQNGDHHTTRFGGLTISMIQPNRIIETLTPAMAISAATSVIPDTTAMSRIISVADSEYSTHRNRLRPAVISLR